MKNRLYQSLTILLLIPMIIISCNKNDDDGGKTFKLTTAVQPAEGGAVTPSKGKYEEGEQISITATASTNWAFKNWSGSLTGSTNPAIVTMSSDKEIIAVFEPSDLDGDGVENDVDNCPETPSGETVDANGCSQLQTDADSDGIKNDDDQCSDTPAGETVDIEGCSDSQKDTDGDGVSDADDLCADTPTGSIVGPIGCADIQVRLNQGETPLEIINSGVAMADLYGKTYQGGLIFYVDPVNGNGLVAAPNDIVSVTWWNGSIVVTGATNPSIGAGQANTTLIINAQGAGQYAASACDSYVSGGYDDWFLPSLGELDAILNNLIALGLGGFGPTNWYWSSTQWIDNPAGAGFLNNDLGSTFPGLDITAAVFARPVRAF